MARYRLHCIGASGNSCKLALYMNCANLDYYPPEETGLDIAADYPGLDAWRRRLAALPVRKPPYDLMPVGTDMRLTMNRPA